MKVRTRAVALLDAAIAANAAGQWPAFVRRLRELQAFKNNLAHHHEAVNAAQAAFQQKMHDECVPPELARRP